MEKEWIRELMLHAVHPATRHQFWNGLCVPRTPKTKGPRKGDQMPALWVPGLLLGQDKNFNKC